MQKWILKILIILTLIFIPYAKGFANTGQQIITGNINISGVNSTIGLFPTHPYIGCSVAVFSDTAATTTATIIPYIAGKTIYVIGIDYYNRSTTGGNVTFSWDDVVCYPAAVSGTIGAGFLPLTYLVSSSASFKVTTPGACGIIVYYKQQ